MRTILFLTLAFLTFVSHATDTVTISGRVTDYNGNPVDSCTIGLYNPNFTTAYETLSGPDGCYAIENVAKGDYAGIFAMRIKEYPRMNQVAPEDMKLEFLAWNVPAHRDLTLDIRYDKLELYGTTAFMEYGGRPELLIYTRPMSVTKVLAFSNYLDKSAAEKEWKVTVDPQYMQFEVYADGMPLKLMSVQHLSFPNANGNALNDDCYLLQTELPKDISDHQGRPYEIRVVGHNTEYDEWGENVYYMHVPAYRFGGEK